MSTIDNNIPAGCLPFDLDKYKAGYPARTRGGKKITFGAHSLTNPSKTVRLVSTLENGEWAYHTESGSYFNNKEDHNDIFLIAPTPTYVPWTSIDEVPDDAWFRRKGGKDMYRINALAPSGVSVRFEFTWYTLSQIFEHYEHHLDRRHTGDWNVCGKPQNT